MVHMIQKEERKSKYAYLSTSDGGSPDFEFPVQDRANISNQKNTQQAINSNNISLNGHHTNHG